MTVFYRKYRPQKLSDIYGQEHVTKTLLSQLESGKISHGYLFSGPRGTGKTSTARILAKAVNCKKVDSSPASPAKRGEQLTVNSSKKSVNREPITVNRFGEPCNKCDACVAITDGSYLDLFEIDAASNRGIDEIRDLREKVKMAPIAGRFKVYIIDEAHMLTNEAFNALLKTLEEPPSHVIFILCTTEEQKLPATIISRLLRFNFVRAKDHDLSSALEKVAKDEKMKINNGAIGAIVRASDGSFRDGISILDQLSTTSSEITESDVLKIIKVSGWNRIYSFVQQLANKNLKELVSQVEQMVEEGGDIALFGREVILFLKQLLFMKIGVEYRDKTSESLEKLVDLSSKFSYGDVQILMKLFLIAESEMKLYPLPQIPLILSVCKYCGDTITDGTEKSEGTEKTAITEDTEKSSTIEDAEKPGEHPRGVASNATNHVGRSEVKTFPGKHPGGESRSETPVKSGQSPSPAKSPKSLAEIEKHWGEFLNKAKPINSHVVALLRSSRPAALEDDKLTVEVFYRFHKEKLEEPKILAMLEGILDEVLGKKVVLKFVLAQKTSSPTKEVQMSDVIDIDQEEISKLAAEIFSK